MRTAVVLFTRDLRVHDHPALATAASQAEHLVSLFVLDDAIRASPNRATFLADSLADLDRSLRRLGSGLVVRRGDTVAEAVRLVGETGADAVFCSADVSAFAQRRQRRLAEALGPALTLTPGVTVVPPGELTPAGSDHFAVFTPFHRRWAATSKRSLATTPDRLPPLPVDPGHVPAQREVCPGATSPDLPPGGETEARRRLDSWAAGPSREYADHHDDLPAARTSRLSPYLHFGCLSPLEVALRCAGEEAFVRQLAWRDFHHQVLAARPGAARDDYRGHGDRWRRDDQALQAWKDGRTGYPVVDAGMRQLAREGWMHNRARLLTASFLTKTLYVDWRLGAHHFRELLVDADVANNELNWQWVAGTGTDTRPNRVLNPLRQAQRFDPDGDYVRRYVPELRGVAGAAVHRPWELAEPPAGYPPPLVDLGEGRQRFQRARGR